MYSIFFNIPSLKLFFPSFTFDYKTTSITNKQLSESNLTFHVEKKFYCVNYLIVLLCSYKVKSYR